MILEQRFGAAQVALRAADALLEHATTGTSASIEDFRCTLFASAWESVCRLNAVGSLVYLIHTILCELDTVTDVAHARRTAIAAIDTFRSELNHRVPDTARHSMTVLNPYRRVMLYGYSTTVLYALQHALRNGQRIDVVSVTGRDSAADHALVERIEAIGLTVSTVPYQDASATLPTVDAVVVGADSLDMYGLTNTAGTTALAVAAHDAHVPFFSFCTSEKFLPNVFFHGEISPWPCVDRRAFPIDARHSPRDVTTLAYISGVITERGSLPAPAIEAWLATERLHPLLDGRGRTLGMHAHTDADPPRKEFP